MLANMRISNTIRLLIVLLFLFSPLAMSKLISNIPFVDADEKNGILTKTSWEEMGKSNLLVSEQRWLYLENNKKVKERKAQMILHDVSPEDIAVKLRNYKLVAEWMTNVDKTQLILRHNKNLWVIFMIFKLPWPLRNRYLIAEVQETRHPFLPLITFTINSSNNYDPPFECEVNDFGRYNSEWKIYALSPSSTFVSFSAYATADPLFPRWLQDPLINRTFIRSMENFYSLFK